VASGQHGREPFPTASRIYDYEEFMRAYLATLTPTIRMLLAVPALLIAYTLLTCVLPAVLRAVVPDSVRSVLSLL
jgi:hypothetical protein